MNTATAIEKHWAGNPLTAQAVNDSRRPQVVEWVGNIESELDHLEKTLVMLQEKSSPISRQSVPSPCLDQKLPPEEMLVPVADKLRAIHRRLQSYIGIVRDVTDRLEV